tara:strand:- start:210 stop:662 length:453 start_codon:yes stop_codon:yes gene_type:complete
MAFKMKGFSGFGNSPMKKNKFTGPIKPMVDKDKDKISDFVDADAGSGKSNKTTQDFTKQVKTIKRDKPKTNLDRLKPNKTFKEIKDTTKRTTDKGKKQFTKKVRPFDPPTRREVISAFINPFDIKSKTKVKRHYLPKIKKFLDTPVKKRK